jgi:hypothetical protein
MEAKRMQTVLISTTMKSYTAILAAALARSPHKLLQKKVFEPEPVPKPQEP